MKVFSKLPLGVAAPFGVLSFFSKYCYSMNHQMLWQKLLQKIKEQKTKKKKTKQKTTNQNKTGKTQKMAPCNRHARLFGHSLHYFHVTLTCQNFMTSELLTFAYCEVYCLTSLENDTNNFQLDRSGNFS